ncbi:MAG: amidase [Aureispira sp.]|nr:amidase [Aureispira sp.]
MKDTNKRVHSFSDDILGDLDGIALAKLIKNKELKAEEVVEASITRAEKVNPRIHAIMTKHFEHGLANAHKHEEGPFGGVPTFFKDMTLVEGVPTYFGSAAFLNAKPAKKTDPIAKQILAQGFVNIGTSTMPEFGFTCSTEFTHQEDTRNPWNIGHTAGGSSGGSAALVAAGVVPLAHSADGGGSTRIPASCCGLVGLKPSRGRILKSSMLQKQLVDIAIDGVITRSVRDTAFFYSEAEKYYKNSKLKPIGEIDGPTKQKLRIGFTSDSVSGLTADATTTAELHRVAKLLEDLGHEVEEVKLPISDQFLADFTNYWALPAFYCKTFGKQLFGKAYDKSKLTKLTNDLAKYHAKNILKTPSFVYRLRKSYRDYKKIFSSLNLDIVLTPTVAAAPPEIGYMAGDLEYDEVFPRMIEWACFTPYSNSSGGPSLSLPLGHDKVTDLPLGMLFWANHGEERLLLELAYQLEEASPWKKITEA